MCLFCSCLFLITDFPFANLGIYYFAVHFAAFGTIFLELTSAQLSPPICASQNVTLPSESVLDKFAFSMKSI